MTTLWDKIQAAVRYVRTTVAAAVASIRVAPTMTPFKLLDGVSADNGAPASDSDGADVAGWATLNLLWVHGTPGSTSEIELYIYDGEDWIYHSTQSLSTDTGLLDAWDIEGTAERVYVRLTTISAGTVTVKLTPHNES